MSRDFTNVETVKIANDAGVSIDSLGGVASMKLLCKAVAAAISVDPEPPSEVPTIISSYAWESAMVIDEQVRVFMAEHGFTRVEGRSKMTEVTAKLVQLAINRALSGRTYREKSL